MAGVRRKGCSHRYMRMSCAPQYRARLSAARAKRADAVRTAIAGSRATRCPAAAKDLDGKAESHGAVRGPGRPRSTWPERSAAARTAGGVVDGSPERLLERQRRHVEEFRR